MRVDLLVLRLTLQRNRQSVVKLRQINSVVKFKNLAQSASWEEFAENVAALQHQALCGSASRKLYFGE
jgi:hypothetical protein